METGAEGIIKGGISGKRDILKTNVGLKSQNFPLSDLGKRLVYCADKMCIVIPAHHTLS
jgi:hypothetical protein